MSKQLQFIQECTQSDLKGKVVLLRLDLNMPIADGVVANEYRIDASMPTINFLRESGAKVIIIAHIESKQTDTLRIVFPVIKKRFENARFCDDIFSDTTKEVVAKMQEADVVLFENLRKWEGEKVNDVEFVKQIADYADLYVNDAFSVCHREHASVVGIPQYIPGYAGLNIQKEAKALSKTFNPEYPFLFIIGGAKFETKLPLLRKFVDVADTVYVGGALANDIYKARGLEVGTSLVSEIDVKEIADKENVRVPEMVIVKRGTEAVTVSVGNKGSDDFDNSENFDNSVQVSDAIYDADPQSIVSLGEIITAAKTIVWNGPLGDYEHGFTLGTQALALAVADSGAYSIVGGGDTLASIQDMNLTDRINFISTGGGAMLDFLANETLPGIEVLKR